MIVLPLAWALVIGTGACVGSFLNVCIHRLPLRESIVLPRSRCPSCGEGIAWYDNLPILSWLFLGGRCRSCRSPIPIRYPLVEASTIVLFALLFAARGPSVLFLIHAVFGAAIIALIVIDARHQILPDAITLPGIAAGLLTVPLRGAAGPFPDFTLASARDALVAAVLGYALPWIVNASYRGWQAARGVPAGQREDGIGRGDFKFLAMIGAFLGVRLLIFTLFFGAISGAVVGLALIRFGGYGWKSKLPYGVFLGGAALLALFAGELWVDWYLRFAGIGR
ncbi:MAG: prepilin peptidase [Acidobacteria bacterium]|nr:prepilin peptidase [Acidobacteriota bacterium]